MYRDPLTGPIQQYRFAVAHYSAIVT